MKVAIAIVFILGTALSAGFAQANPVGYNKQSVGNDVLKSAVKVSEYIKTAVSMYVDSSNYEYADAGRRSRYALAAHLLGSVGSTYVYDIHDAVKELKGVDYRGEIEGLIAVCHKADEKVALRLVEFVRLAKELGDENMHLAAMNTIKRMRQNKRFLYDLLEKPAPAQ